MAESSFHVRFGEPVKFLPVAFVFVNICFLYFVYMWWHIGLLLDDPDPDMRNKGFREAICFNVVSVLLITCYLRCILVHPGAIPTKEEDPSWEFIPRDSAGHGDTSAGISLQESKRSGDRRHCKWCTKFKPDRCHHCRVCKTCILKMDHHCPWIYNCVGFKNHKYFFLLLFYSVIDLWLIVWTMLPSVTSSTDSTIPFSQMFCLLFGETLASFLSVLLTGFFFFHVYLMQKAMTTIEFCEKNMKSKGHGASLYDRGPYGNVCAVLGDNPLLWLLPLNPPAEGNGIYFLGEGRRALARDLEARRGFSKKGKHRRSKGHGDYGAATVVRGAPKAGAPPSASLLEDPFQSFVFQPSSREEVPLFTGYAASLRGEHV
mmetsp:Transcript_104936/g.273906  ORF Transcript_104936/g.273906 Transcript_104936/m.273906 type:complete len:373 (-) Transcript_104936:93-1211(-)